MHFNSSRNILTAAENMPFNSGRNLLTAAENMTLDNSRKYAFRQQLKICLLTAEDAF